MFEQNSNAPDVFSPGAIAEWKESVSAFFSGEWDNLRELIRRLEEQDWEEVQLTAAPVERPVSVRPDLPVPSGSAGADQSRLEDLARRLERRLQENCGHV